MSRMTLGEKSRSRSDRTAETRGRRTATLGGRHVERGGSSSPVPPGPGASRGIRFNNTAFRAQVTATRTGAESDGLDDVPRSPADALDGGERTTSISDWNAGGSGSPDPGSDGEANAPLRNASGNARNTSKRGKRIIPIPEWNAGSSAAADPDTDDEAERLLRKGNNSRSRRETTSISGWNARDCASDRADAADRKETAPVKAAKNDRKVEREEEPESSLQGRSSDRDPETDFDRAANTSRDVLSKSRSDSARATNNTRFSIRNFFGRRPCDQKVGDPENRKCEKGDTPSFFAAHRQEKKNEASARAVSAPYQWDEVIRSIVSLGGSEAEAMHETVPRSDVMRSLKFNFCGTVLRNKYVDAFNSVLKLMKKNQEKAHSLGNIFPYKSNELMAIVNSGFHVVRTSQAIFELVRSVCKICDVEDKKYNSKNDPTYQLYNAGPRERYLRLFLQVKFQYCLIEALAKKGVDALLDGDEGVTRSFTKKFFRNNEMRDFFRFIGANAKAEVKSGNEDAVDDVLLVGAIGRLVRHGSADKAMEILADVRPSRSNHAMSGEAETLMGILPGFGYSQKQTKDIVAFADRLFERFADLKGRTAPPVLSCLLTIVTAVIEPEGKPAK